MNDNICQICGKSKKGNEETMWLHWQCFFILKDFVAEKYGKLKSTNMWKDKDKPKWLKEYLKQDRETVQFT